MFQDNRGFFYESFNAQALSASGVSEEFVQDNHVLSEKGVLRGLHFQRVPKAQAKLVRVIKGAIFDVAVDIRKDSPTFGQWVGETIDDENRRMIYVPAGFAHGYLSLEKNTEVLYKVTDYYSPSDEAGIIWNDPTIGVKWPVLDADYIVSEKDQILPQFKELIPV